MKRETKEKILAVLFILIISIISINNKESSTNDDFEKSTLLYEEAKFYGINTNFDNLNVQKQASKFNNQLNFEQARFWGIPTSILRNN